MYKIAALYKFTPLEDIPDLRREILEFGETCEGMCGTLLLAPEGINGTIGARPEALEPMIDFLDEKCGVRDGELKYSDSALTPFNRFKVRPKKEIITMRCAEADPHKQVGTYVAPEDWNDIISDPEVTLIDTRNEYETRLGVFKGAHDPHLDVFTEFSDYVEQELDPAKTKKVAMYCTGGIRCEKASSYMLAKGFEEVYHLKGGILKYLETIPADQSLWEGDCFVFDKRVAVTHGLKKSDWTICHGCREPLSKSDTMRIEYEEGVSCHHCRESLTESRSNALRQRHQDFLRREQAASEDVAS